MKTIKRTEKSEFEGDCGRKMKERKGRKENKRNIIIYVRKMEKVKREEELIVKKGWRKKESQNSMK